MRCEYCNRIQEQGRVSCVGCAAPYTLTVAQGSWARQRNDEHFQKTGKSLNTKQFGFWNWLTTYTGVNS